MNTLDRTFVFSAGFLLAFPALAWSQGQAPLPSWNDTDAKRAIVAFVETVTDEDGEGFVPPAERIAVFDNDGTLWAEQPAYFQLFYTIDRARQLAEESRQLAERPAFKAVLEEDLEALAAMGHEGIEELLMTTHAGMTAEDFTASVRDWLATARHPTLDRPYTELVYQPQLELLDYLRDHGFKTFIVSGGGVDFIRAFAEEVYGIPPEQVVGSSIHSAYVVFGEVPTLVKRPEVAFVDDKEGKPVGIHQHIGRRPILAFGNSDGDLAMLEYTTMPRSLSDDTPRLGLILHHDDAEREFAYDRMSRVGRLARALDVAPKRNWVVVSMTDDWNSVFPDG